MKKYFLYICFIIIGLNNLYSNIDYWVKSEIEVGSSTNAVYDVCYLSSNNTYYAVMQSFGVIKSTNQGISWVSAENNLSGKSINKIIALNSNTLVAASNSDGVYISTNGGSSWLLKNSGMTNKRVVSLAKDHLGNLYAGTWFEGGLFKSTNNGEVWTEIGLKDKDITSIFVASNNDIFAGIEGQGIFKSSNGGALWENMGIYSMNVFSFAEDSFGGIYASCFDGLRYLSPASNNWQKLQLPLNTSLINHTILSDDGFFISVGANSSVIRKFNNNGEAKLLRSQIIEGDLYKSIMLPDHSMIIVGSKGIFISKNSMIKPSLFLQTNPYLAPVFTNASVKFRLSAFNDDSLDAGEVRYKIYNEFFDEFTTTSSGTSQYDYSFQVPKETENGFYTLRIVAEKDGYNESEKTIQFELRIDNRKPIVLSIELLSKNRLNIGGEYKFAINAKDDENNPISNATLSIYNPFKNSIEDLETDENGSLVYSGKVPTGVLEDGYTFTFTAEKEDFIVSQTRSMMIIVDFSVSVLEAYSSDILVFPNPSSNFIKIQSDKEYEIIKIMSIDGKEHSLLTQSDYIDITRLPDAQYILIIKRNNDFKTLFFTKVSR